MKLQSRKNRTVVITADVESTGRLIAALDALQAFHWRMARQEPEGSTAEKEEREQARAAVRLLYELRNAQNHAVHGTAETTELTDAAGPPQEHFNHVNL